MWHIFTSLTNLAIYTTQPLERWMITIAILLEKDKVSSKNKLTARYRKIRGQLQSSIETITIETNNITYQTRRNVRKSQLETRPHKTSNDSSVINELILDIFRIESCIVTMKQNNASACYDRTIANYSSINSQREGTP